MPGEQVENPQAALQEGLEQARQADIQQETPSGAAPAPSPSPVAAPSSAAAPAAASAPSFREQLRPFGIDPAAHQDDASALAALQQRFGQLGQYAQYGQYYAQNHQAFSEWQRQQAEAQRAAAAQAKPDAPWYSKWHSPPEWDAGWLNLIERGDNGQLQIKAGHDPAILHKALAYRDWEDAQIKKFVSNPYTFLEEPIKHLASQEAQRIANERLGTYHEHRSANEFVAQNASWMYETDKAGKPVTDVFGNRRLNEMGTRFAQYVERAAKMGLDVEQQKEMAIGFLQRDVLMAQQQRSQAVQNGDRLKQQAISNQQPAPSFGGGTQIVPNDLVAEPAQQDIKRMLMEDLAAAGITSID